VATAAFPKHRGCGQKICRGHQINDLAAKVASVCVPCGGQIEADVLDAWQALCVDLVLLLTKFEKGC